jgi:hypothetical protein
MLYRFPNRKDWLAFLKEVGRIGCKLGITLSAVIAVAGIPALFDFFKTYNISGLLFFIGGLVLGVVMGTVFYELLQRIH